ncbi:MAG: hypothetical protein MUP16_11120 [Sedimentisphaerales bacterium]|nr:hypothetical protein [Sedimentisphaerales bacterium]
MLAELQTIDIGDVTLTKSMIMLGVIPMLIVQLLKAWLVHFWPAGPEEIKKPLFTLVGIFTAVLMFYALAMEDWFMGGIVIGLTSIGGYETAKNTAGLAKKKLVPNGGTVPLAMVLLLCSLLLVGGCISAQPNPRADLVASQKIFAATVDSLTALQQAGKFTAEETKEIGIFIDLGHEYLDQWSIAVKAGQFNPNIAQSVQVVLNKLIEYQITVGTPK